MPSRKLTTAQVAPLPCDYDLAAAYVAALTGSVDTVMDWRCLSDTDMGAPGHARRGTLPDLWPWIEAMNAAGYGAFVSVNETDGFGRSADNIIAARAAWVDLDGDDSADQYRAAMALDPAPSFAVQSSPGRWHLYWRLAQACPVDMAESLTKRLTSHFNGDRAATDRARVLRLAGTANYKRARPSLVGFQPLPGASVPVDWLRLDTALPDQPERARQAGRHDLGTPELAAPSLDWLQRALDLTDPNDLDRDAWISTSAAVKQAGWSLTDEPTLRAMWLTFCSRYYADDPAENEKQWSSIRNSEVGWQSLVHRNPPLKAALSFGDCAPTLPPGASATPFPVLIAANDGAARPISATPYSWRDARTIPPRPWLLGHWMLKGEVSAVVAPGGTGKSTIGVGMGLSLATDRSLLGKSVHDGPHSAWLFNLEDGIDELERQVGAATIYHGIERSDCGDRLFLDSGTTQPLRTATETRDGFTIDESAFDAMAATIRNRSITAVIVDPFISSHTVSEASNEAIDAIVKRWKRLAQETGCAVVLVHHTRKLGGREATAEDGRGAVALRDAARVVLALNPMNDDEGKRLGIVDPVARRSIVRVDMGKANRAPADRATWIKLEGQDLGNGTPSRPADNVAVATAWERPDILHGFTSDHLRQLQRRLDAHALRKDAQAIEWVGYAIAEIAELDRDDDGHVARIKAVLAAWLEDGSLAIEPRDNGKGGTSPFVVTGRSVDQMPGQPPAR